MPSRRDVDEAQDLIYEAWETDDSEQRQALARTALSYSPDAADAYVMLAEAAATAAEALSLYRQGVAAGERAIGARAFREDAGHFWGILETRPYMRARAGLARSLWETGEREAALEHWREMLDLNPGDNQGMRYVLLPRLIEAGRDDDAEGLLAAYEDDASSDWVYGRLLLHFRRHGAQDAGMLLGDAFAVNPFIPEYLTGRRPIPVEDDLPDTVGFGDETEAEVYAWFALPAWRSTPGAVEWLALLLDEADRALGES
jgi:tetratricopeptide (TPR) repeat protein